MTGIPRIYSGVHHTAVYTIQRCSPRTSKTGATGERKGRTHSWTATGSRWKTVESRPLTLLLLREKDDRLRLLLSKIYRSHQFVPHLRYSTTCEWCESLELRRHYFCLPLSAQRCASFTCANCRRSWNTPLPEQLTPWPLIR